MYKGIRNIIVYTEATNNWQTLNYYISVSGRRYYVKSQRYVHAIHHLLKDGISIEELIRWDGHGPIGKAPTGYINTGKLTHTLKHVLPVIDFVLEDEGLIKPAA